MSYPTITAHQARLSPSADAARGEQFARWCGLPQDAIRPFVARWMASRELEIAMEREDLTQRVRELANSCEPLDVMRLRCEWLLEDIDAADPGALADAA